VKNSPLTMRPVTRKITTSSTANAEVPRAVAQSRDVIGCCPNFNDATPDGFRPTSRAELQPELSQMQV